MKTLVNHKNFTFTAPGVLSHDGKFSGWRAINIGTETAEVLGTPLLPGAVLDMTNIPAEVVWNTDIIIGYASANAKVTITTLTYA